MLFKSLNDAWHCCMYRLFVYAGKPNKLPSLYVAGTPNYIKEPVTSVEKSTCLQGNISMDCLYMSIPIAKLLLGKNITCVGTFQSNKVGIADEIKSTKDRADFSSCVYWEKDQGDLSITSHHT